MKAIRERAITLGRADVTRAHGRNAGPSRSELRDDPVRHLHTSPRMTRCKRHRETLENRRKLGL